MIFADRLRVGVSHAGGRNGDAQDAGVGAGCPEVPIVVFGKVTGWIDDPGQAAFVDNLWPSQRMELTPSAPPLKTRLGFLRR